MSCAIAVSLTFATALFFAAIAIHSVGHNEPLMYALGWIAAGLMTVGFIWADRTSAN